MRRYHVIDCETTGFEGDPELMEIARCIVTLDSERNVSIGEPISQLYKPTCAIEPGARAVHNITAKMVADCFPVTSEDRQSFVIGDEAPAVIVAHSAEYEKKFFAKEIGEIPVLCTYKSALRVWPDAPSHSNGVLYYWLQDMGIIADLGEAAHPMHRAGPDTLITAHILAALLTRATTQEMLAWSGTHALLPTCPIGKHRGAKWADVDHGFLQWMLNKAPDMSAELKWNAEQEIIRRRQAR